MTLDLLRFTTAGSVDDGKSTLIGRLLYDTKQVFEDQLDHVAQASERRGGEGALDLALLTDGLRAEREQGITIDVAYRYFATARRRFIIADCPGHQQYTRNMVTGASTADLSVILLDARKGVLEQSKRHAFISALLGIPHLVVAVNKMDLVDYSQERFDELVAEFEVFAQKLNGIGTGTGMGRDITYIPISALNGDNVVDRSQNMRWYEDAGSPDAGSPDAGALNRGDPDAGDPAPISQPTLLELLEQVEVAYDHPYDRPARFPVQWVIRPSVNRSPPTHSDYRGYAGQVASGAFRAGEQVVVLPSGQRTSIEAIDTYDGELPEALAPMSVTLRLSDELDISRGETICRPEQAPVVARELEADVCWMTDAPLRKGARYIVKHTTREVTAIVDDLCDHVDVHTLERAGAPRELALNDIGRVRLRTSAPLVFDPYEQNRRTGSFILIDEVSNDTVGAGLIH
jgi:small GTP-binding protein